MELGPILALLSAACFAGMQVLVRRGVYRAEESFTAAAIGILVGTILLLPILPLTGDWNRLWLLSWQGFIFLGTAGIIHLVLGRFLFFTGIRLIGANKASPILATNTLFAATFGVTFLHETLTIPLIAGVLCIMVGASLVSFEGKERFFGFQAKGALFVVASALCVATSAVLIKSAMGEIGSPYAAAFISYAAGSVLWTILLSRKGERDQLLQLPRYSLIILIIAGAFGLVGQVLRYAALGYSPVSVVQPLFGTVSVFVLFLSFILNRNIDVFTWGVLIGIVFTVTGTFLLFT